MGLLIDKKILFTHIPKTGGTTMVRNFKSAYGTNRCEWEGNHLPLSHLYKKCEQIEIDPDDLHKVSVVRNPWTRMFSTWRYYSTIKFVEFYSGDEKIDSDFNKWTKWVYEDFDRSRLARGAGKYNMFKYHFNDQLNWFKDEEGNILKVDNILRTENLTKQMPVIAERYCWKSFQIKVNATNNNKVADDYKDTYNQESIDLVAKHFAEDIATFDYDYEGE